MRTLIIVAVIFHLGIIVVEINGYTIGDIISFPRKCTCIPGKPEYKHFAVYVGPGKFPNQGDNDMFHRIREVISGSYCSFGKLQSPPYEGGTKENYLDDLVEPGVQYHVSEDTIMARIKETLKNCGTYNLLTNNCEHAATYVRYGVPNVWQPGTVVEGLCRLASCGKMRERLNKIKENAKIEQKCMETCKSSNVAAG